MRPEGDGDEWMRWSASAEAAGLVRARPDGRREVSLLLEGVTCGACVPLLESWLARQPGVVEAGVNYATRRAHVAFDPAVTQLSSVLRAIAASGYSAFPYDPARREALARRERRALLTRTAIALLAMMQVMMFALPVYLSDDGVAPRELRLLEWASFVLTLPALFYSGAPLFANAWRDLRHRRLGMDVPIALGLAAAFAASAWATFGAGGPVYYDSVTMFIALLLVARYFELVDAAAGRRGDRGDRAPAAGHGGTPRRLARARRARDDRGRRTRPRGRRAGPARRAGARRRRRRRRPLARRGSDAHRRKRARSARRPANRCGPAP